MPRTKIDKKKIAKNVAKKIGKKPSTTVGRPTKMTTDVLKKLKDAFAYGCTDEEACYYAEITTTTLYNYQLEHPEFIEEKRILKERPIFLARKKVVETVSVDAEMAMKFLERKKKDEFSTAPTFMQQVNVNNSNNTNQEDDTKDLTVDEKVERLEKAKRAYKKEGEYATTPIDSKVRS